jgi:C1A family cysteine protease
MLKHRYGWRPSRPDHRDHIYNATLEHIASLPASADLRSQCPPVYDQGELGSCTANAIAAAIEFDRMKQGLPDFVPSRLFVYYNERAMEGTVDSDSGAAIRDGIKSVNRQGACSETEWPYDISKFTVKPSPQCYKDALLDKALKYQSVSRNLNQMKSCLASGLPFVFGFTVYESFESDEVARTGIVPMPQSDEQVLGGHAVIAVGYQDAQQCFIVRNSWSDQWGDNGYCYMPYDYLMHKGLASDFWVVQSVS